MCSRFRGFEIFDKVKKIWHLIRLLTQQQPRIKNFNILDGEQDIQLKQVYMIPTICKSKYHFQVHFQCSILYFQYYTYDIRALYNIRLIQGWFILIRISIWFLIQPIEINDGDKIHFSYLLEKKLHKKVRKSSFSSNQLNWSWNHTNKNHVISTPK